MWKEKQLKYAGELVTKNRAEDLSNRQIGIRLISVILSIRKLVNVFFFAYFLDITPDHMSSVKVGDIYPLKFPPGILFTKKHYVY